MSSSFFYSAAKESSSKEEDEGTVSCLYYLMGFVQDDEKEGLDVFLQGDGLKEQHGGMLGIHFLDKSNGSFELLLILGTSRKKHMWDEKTWEAFANEHIEERWRVKVQTTQMVAKGQSGSSCVMRLIEKNLRAMMDVGDKLFDGYRIASGGRMHPMDQRPWRMKACVLKEMKLERLEYDSAVSKLHEKIVEVILYCFFSRMQTTTNAS